MATNNPRGLVEVRHLTGHHSPATRRYKVKADGLSGSGQKFAGAPVVLVSGHSVKLHSADASAGSLPILGVIRAVYDSNGKPFTHSLPAGGSFIPASAAGIVDVNVDPHQVYLVNTDGTADSTDVGSFVNVSGGVANTAAGRSGHEVVLGGIANTATAAKPFQIVAVGANNLDGIVGGEANQDVEVIIVNHAFGSRTADKVR